MDRTFRRHRRSTVTVLSAVVGIVATAVLSGPVAAVSAAGAEAARSNARWLSRQLAPDGTLQNPLGGALPDHGLMIDTLFALRAAGEGELATPIARYLDDGRRASDYFTWDGLVPGMGYDAVIVGGATAKVLVAAQVAGRNPRAFGGYDMVAETQGTIRRSGPDKGRVSDYAKKPELADSVTNNANVFGQALGVIGLAGVGENDRLAIDTLIGQQCSEGYFRIFFGYIPTTETGDHVTPTGNKLSTCDEGKSFGQSAPDGDATGLGLSALLAARHAGATGLDGPIEAAVRWLTANQKPGGGWGGGVSTEAPNTNSTGLIVQALADAGDADDAVARGTAFLKSAQATAEADRDSALSGQIGAIAYTPEEYQAARTAGIVGLDTWIRASAQATLGLSRIGLYALAKGRVPPPGGDPTPTPTPTPSTPTPTPTRTPTPTPSPSGTPTVRPPDSVMVFSAPDESPTDRPHNAKPTPKPTAKPPTGSKPTVRPSTRLLPRPNGARRLPPPVPPRRGDPGRDRPSADGRPAPMSTPQARTEPAAVGPAGRLGAYLAGRLVDGHHIEVTEGNETYVDYDATADLVLALRALGEQPAAVTRASRFLLRPDSIQAYAHGAPYEQAPAAYAQPLAKLQIIARFLQTEPGAPADLTATADRLGDGLTQLSTAQGRFNDLGAYGDQDDLVVRHAWAMLAVTAGGPPDAAAAPLDALLRSQCSDGSFPASLDSEGCASGDLAATAAAITALTAEPEEKAKSTPGEQRRPTALANAVTAPGEQRRSTALADAVAALTANTSDDGLVRTDGQVDVVLSASAAVGRRVAGLDTQDTARALGALLRTDGGLGRPGTGSDPPTSIAAAPGVAGRAWLNLPDSPVTTGLSLLGRETATARSSAATADKPWPTWPLFALGAAVVVAGLGYAGHRLGSRRPSQPKAPARPSQPKASNRPSQSKAPDRPSPSKTPNRSSPEGNTT
jgi:hypothetical protein